MKPKQSNDSSQGSFVVCRGEKKFVAGRRSSQAFVVYLRYMFNNIYHTARSKVPNSPGNIDMDQRQCKSRAHSHEQGYSIPLFPQARLLFFERWSQLLSFTMDWRLQVLLCLSLSAESRKHTQIYEFANDSQKRLGRVHETKIPHLLSLAHTIDRLLSVMSPLHTNRTQLLTSVGTGTSRSKPSQ